MTELPDLSLFQAAAALRSGAMTSRALVQAVLDRIVARKDRDAFTHVAADALAQADAADAMLAAGHDPGPFCGLPVAVKDMTDVAGSPPQAARRCWRAGLPQPTLRSSPGFGRKAPF